MTAAAHGNGYDPDRVKQCVERIEAIERERERHHMEYMGECSRLAEDRKAVYDEAKNAWQIPKRALKTVIKGRAAERKLEALRADLEADDQEAFDQIRHALGDLADTPLGEAATNGKGERKKKDAALNAAAGGDIAAQNAERLSTGISPLPN